MVVVGGMGEGARQKLASNNIEVITGASGKIEDVINAYMNGTLKSSGTGCSEHDHSHGHEHGDGGCSCGHN